MGGCHTDCLEKPLSRGFRNLGKLIARYPWWFIVIPVAFSVGLGMGFCFLEERQMNNLEDQFTPVGGHAKNERDFVQAHFPINDSRHFSVERLYAEGTFASLIIVSSSQNVLNKNIFEDLHRLDTTVKSLECGSNISFYHLCAKTNGSTCLPANPLLEMIQNNTEEILLTYPMFKNTIFLGFYIGGVTLGSDSSVLKAQAIRLLYYLREDSNQVKSNALRWLNHFTVIIPQKIQELHLKSIQVYYSTSISLQRQLQENTKNVIAYFSITYLVTLLFSIVSCMRLDNVRNKIGVTAFGVLSPGLAILTSFGLLLLCGVPFAVTAVNAPFLILGVGVDNMFIILSCWQQTKVKASIEERMANTYQDAAVSITITTLTDVLAFYISIITHFPSVQSFCLYTGTALVFCYLYCVTFFGAILALNGKYENENRHWLTCMKLKNTEEPGHSPAYNACCVGGSLDTVKGIEHEHPITVFFYQYYGPFITQYWIKVLVLFLYFGYLIASIFGCIQIEEGIDVRYLANDHSFLKRFYNKEALYFSEYGPRVMVIVTNATNYWEIETRQEIEGCMEALESSYYVTKEYSVSWLRTYERLSRAANLNITSKENFMKHLKILYSQFSDFRLDIEQHGSEIIASRFFIQTFHLFTGHDAKKMVHQLREIAANCRIKLIVYHPLFIYLDQYAVIIQNTVQNIIVATVVMLVISLLFIPNPLCSLWVTFAIASIIVGVIGFMGFWKVNLDSISMINLVICIGFSVDFSAHIAYACVSNKKTGANDRVIDALRVLGYPVVQGALSTILGILALSVAESYIFRTFFKIMFLVIVFGVLHGLIFIPVFLTTLGVYEISCNKKVTPQNTNMLNTEELGRGYPEGCESRMKMQELPGYVSPISCVMNSDSLCKFYYPSSPKNFSGPQKQDGLHEQNQYKNNLLQYRRRLFHLYMEGKVNQDCH